MIKCSEYSSQLQDKLDHFFTDVFISNGFSYSPDGTHKDLKNIEHIFCSPGGEFLILMDNSKIIGTAGLKIIDKQNQIVELKCMYILSEYQNIGLGKQLLETIVNKARSKKLKFIRLDVKPNAHKAISLYKSFGFTEIPKYNNNINQVIFMELAI